MAFSAISQAPLKFRRARPSISINLLDSGQIPKVQRLRERTSMVLLTSRPGSTRGFARAGGDGREARVSPDVAGGEAARREGRMNREVAARQQYNRGQV
jgi:hypothetical protein